MAAPAPPRAVLDTNVLLDFWVFDDPRARALKSAIEQQRVLALATEAHIGELAEVLARSKFALSQAQQLAILDHWRGLAQIVAEARPAPLVCRDPDDQKFLDLAFSERANWLISKDKALLGLARPARRFDLLIAGPADAPLTAA